LNRVASARFATRVARRQFSSTTSSVARVAPAQTATVSKIESQLPKLIFVESSSFTKSQNLMQEQMKLLWDTRITMELEGSNKTKRKAVKKHKKKKGKLVNMQR
jgi:hypothetical protein